MAHLLLNLTYIGFAATATFGAVLFIGFTFRPAVSFLWFNLNDPAYPRPVVIGHLLTAVATFGLFTASMANGGTRNPAMVVAYVLTFFTLGIGVAFFIRFDYWSRPLRWRLVAVHLILAVCTAISATVALGLSQTQTSHLSRNERGYHSSVWNNVRQNLEILRRQNLENAAKKKKHG